MRVLAHWKPRGHIRPVPDCARDHALLGDGRAQASWCIRLSLRRRVLFMIDSCWPPRMIHALATATRVADLSDDRIFERAMVERVGW